MPEKMLAVMKKERAPGAELVEVDIPNIKPDEVLLKVRATSSVEPMPIYIIGTNGHKAASNLP